jgi:hypothetical protein
LTTPLVAHNFDLVLSERAGFVIMLAYKSNFSGLKFAIRELYERFILKIKVNSIGAHVNWTDDCEFLYVDVLCLNMTFEHGLCKLVLPDLPFSLNNVDLYLDASTCLLIDLARELAPIMIMS